MIPLKATRGFGRDPSEIGVARRWVEGIAWAEGLPHHRVVDLVLVVSELVTNVLLHTSSEALVTVRADDYFVALEVADGEGAMAVPPPVDSGAIGGRGLMMVGALVDQWGVAPSPDGGKVVWSRIRKDLSGQGASVGDGLRDGL